MILKWRGEELLVKYGDVRRFMDFSAFVFGLVDKSSLPHGQAWSIIQARFEAQAPRHFTTFGFNLKAGEWHTTADSKKYPRVALALEFFVRNVWNLKDVFAVRIDKALSKLPPQQAADYTMVLRWKRHPEGASQHEIAGALGLSTAELAGMEWELMIYVQTFHQAGAEVDLRTVALPET